MPYREPAEERPPFVVRSRMSEWAICLLFFVPWLVDSSFDMAFDGASTTGLFDVGFPALMALLLTTHWRHSGCFVEMDGQVLRASTRNPSRAGLGRPKRIEWDIADITEAQVRGPLRQRKLVITGPAFERFTLYEQLLGKEFDRTFATLKRRLRPRMRVAEVDEVEAAEEVEVAEELEAKESDEDLAQRS